MLVIDHRINTVEALVRVPSHRGVEIDLRYAGKQVVLNHEPFGNGEPFEIFLRHYRHRFFVLNVKNEGIEHEVIRLVNAYGIEEYFLLDLSFPALYKLACAGNRHLAIRFSEAEPVEACLAVKGMVDWVWVDCFTRLPLTAASYRELRPHFKLCLVSPEVQGHPESDIWIYQEQLRRDGIEIDAVCTDFPDRWDEINR